MNIMQCLKYIDTQNDALEKHISFQNDIDKAKFWVSKFYLTSLGKHEFVTLEKCIKNSNFT